MGGVGMTYVELTILATLGLRRRRSRHAASLCVHPEVVLEVCSKCDSLTHLYTLFGLDD